MSESLPTTEAPLAPSPRLTRMERGELVLIACAIGLTWLLSGGLSWSPQLKWLIGYCAALILAQGLVRDLVRLALIRSSGAKRKIACLCAESTIGLSLLLAGTGGLALLNVTETKTLTQTSLTVLVATLLGVGFFAKDYVISIRKERDHASILVSW